MTWRVALRREHVSRELHIPTSILTVAPGFVDERIASEAALLLPNSASNEAFLEAVTKSAVDTSDIAIGLFLADPFLKQEALARQLRKIGCAWVSNLPSVVQQDQEFSALLGDVGLDFKREIGRLAVFAGSGLCTLAVVSNAAEARQAMAIEPNALLVLPRVADFAAGFPSFRQRGSAIALVFDALYSEGWTGTLLCLATVNEADHETLWPAQLTGVVTRPVPITPEGRT